MSNEFGVEVKTIKLDVVAGELGELVQLPLLVEVIVHLEDPWDDGLDHVVAPGQPHHCQKGVPVTGAVILTQADAEGLGSQGVVEHQAARLQRNKVRLFKINEIVDSNCLLKIGVGSLFRLILT